MISKQYTFSKLVLVLSEERVHYFSVDKPVLNTEWCVVNTEKYVFCPSAFKSDYWNAVAYGDTRLPLK